MEIAFAVTEKGELMAEYIVAETVYPLGTQQEIIGELIRCKDCKYAHITYKGEVKYCDIWFPDESYYIDTDNYCSFAERRNDD